MENDPVAARLEPFPRLGQSRQEVGRAEGEEKLPWWAN
jgi:hypothetical protein